MTTQLELLLIVTNYLKKNNVEYFLTFGTLLGAIREKSFLKHDSNDIDIGIKQEDYWKVRRIFDNQDNIKYKNIWRTEIAVYINDLCHLDMFFFSTKDDKVVTSAYLRNCVQSGINIESGMIFNKEYIFPLKEIDFCGQSFTIPNNPEKHLEEHYGSNWKTPVTKWVHTKVQSFNENHRTIGILMPTFLRDEKMIASIKSILKVCDDNNMFRKWVRIYVGDQGHKEWSSTKINFYNKLKEKGHKVFKLPFNCGLSYSRNYLVKQSNEPYLMIIDDDFNFNKNSDISAFIEILNHKEENGIVGGAIENRPSYHADLVFEKRDDDLYLNRIKKISEKQTVEVIDKNTIKVYDYYYTDIVLNFFLAKRKVLEDIPLDNNLKIVEHTDHFLRIKKNSNWRVCYYSKTTCSHIDGIDPDEYQNFRQNEDYVMKFLNKWNIQSERFIRRIDEINILEIPYHKKIKVVQIARIPCANSGYELSKLINEYSTKYESKYILGAEYTKGNKTIPYRQFPYELFWKDKPEECIKAIQDADIIHIHHDIWPELIPYLKDKKIISTIYNLTNSLQYDNSDFNRKYLDKLKELGAVTIADQPLQKKMFSDISSIHVPLVKMLFDYEYVKNEKITIGYSPTNREKIGIGSKRFHEVMTIIHDLQKKYDFIFDLIEGIPYEENLERKSKCHILIDDVDDRYEKAHNSTLEASLLNAVALTNYEGKWFPAIKTNINNLKDTLILLLENPDKINNHIEKLQMWKENIYTPSNLLNIYENLYANNISTKNLDIKIFTKNDYEYKNEFNKIYNLFENNNIRCTLMQKTCADVVNYGKSAKNRETIYLGVDNFSKAKRLLKNFESVYDIHLEKYKGKTKKLGYLGTARNVPFPVIGYLDRLYGENWRHR